MSTLFADTSFFVAYLNRRDEFREIATEHMADPANRMVTTEWVIVELGNYLAEDWTRGLFGSLVRELRLDPRF